MKNRRFRQVFGIAVPAALLSGCGASTHEARSASNEPDLAALPQAVGEALHEWAALSDPARTAAYYQDTRWHGEDLNGDGVAERFCDLRFGVMENGERYSVGGATGNRPCFVFTWRDGRWRQIADLSGEMYWVDQETRVNGWATLIADSDMGGGERGRTVLHYQGRQYAEVESKTIQVEGH